MAESTGAARAVAARRGPSPTQLHALQRTTGNRATVLAIQRVGPTIVGDIRDRQYAQKEEEEIPPGALDAAQSAWLTQQMVEGGHNSGDYGGTYLDDLGDAGELDTGALGTTTDAVGAVGAGSLITVFQDIAAAATELIQGIKLHRKQKLGKDNTGQMVTMKSSPQVNLGAQKLESAITSLATGGIGGTTASSKVLGLLTDGAAEIPFIDVVINAWVALVKFKKGIEDSAGAGRLGTYARAIKTVEESYWPDEVRQARLKAFLAEYKKHLALGAPKQPGPIPRAIKALKELPPKAAKAIKGLPARIRGKQPAAGTQASPSANAQPKLKRGEAERFTTAWKTHVGNPAVPDAAAIDAMAGNQAAMKSFLDKLTTAKEKDFGYAKPHRSKALAAVSKTAQKRAAKKAQSAAAGGASAAAPAAATKAGKELHGLHKAARFGERRMAETSTLALVGCLGALLDAIGTFTAGGDFGATKASGKAIKGGSGLYQGVKRLGKRGKRVGKLGKGRNLVDYGGKSNRGVLWGTKMFFTGGVATSQTKTKKALKSGTVKGKRGRKTVDKRVSGTDDEKKRAKQLVVIQAIRRANDIIKALGSDTDRVYEEAKKIVHIVAETNIAGWARKVADTDLDEFRRLAQDVKAKKKANQPMDKKDPDFMRYKALRGMIKEIFLFRTGGVGG